MTKSIYSKESIPNIEGEFIELNEPLELSNTIEDLKNNLSIEINDEGVFLNLTDKNFINNIKNTFKDIVKGGFYIYGINYNLIQEIIYNNSFQGNYIKLGNGLKEFSSKEIYSYRKRIKRQSTNAVFDFSYLIFENQYGENEVLPDLDKVISMLIYYGVVSGIKIDEISNNIEKIETTKKNQGIITIASQIEPQDGTDDQIKILIDLETDKTPIELENGNVDMRRYNCIFPSIDIEKNNIILEKIPSNNGTHGMTINGEIINQKKGNYINLKSFSGIGTEVKIIDGKEYLIAKQSGLISKNKSGKIDITNYAKNEDNIGPNTGIVEISNSKFLQKGNIESGYGIVGKDIYMNGLECSGFIHSNKGKIVIKGNVINGEIKNKSGLVKVSGICSGGTYIESLSGYVELREIENSTIIGTNIKIKKSSNCTIIGDDIIIEESKSNTIHGNNIEIKKSFSGKEKKDIIISYLKKFPKLEQAIESLQKSITLKEEKKDELSKNLESFRNDPYIEKLYSLRKSIKYQGLESSLKGEKKKKYEKLMEILESKIGDILFELENIDESIVKTKEKIFILQEKINQINKELQNNLSVSIGNVNENCLIDWYMYENKYYESLSNDLSNENINFLLKVCKLDFPQDGNVFYQQITNSGKKTIESINSSSKINNNLENFGERRDIHRVSVYSDSEIMNILDGNIEEFDITAKVFVNGVWNGVLYDMSYTGVGLRLENHIEKPVVLYENDIVDIVLSILGEVVEFKLKVRWVIEYNKIVSIGGNFIKLDDKTDIFLKKIKHRLEFLKSKGYDPKND